MFSSPINESIIRTLTNSLKDAAKQEEEAGKGKTSAYASPREKAETVQVFDRAHDFFDLSDSQRLNSWLDMDSQEKKEFVQMVAKLAKRGLVGYEILDIGDKPYKSFATTQIADEKASNAHVYDKNGYFKNLP